MKTNKELLTGKKSSWKIVDEMGNDVMKGFRAKQSAKNELSRLKIHKREKLKVVEEVGKCL